MARVPFGPRRVFSAPFPCATVAGEVVLDGISAGLSSLGVFAVDVAMLPLSSSSRSDSPKDNFPFATAFRFFFFGASFRGGMLCFDH